MRGLLLRSVARELLVPLLVWVGALWALLFTMQALKGSEILLGSAVTPGDVGRLLLYLTPHFLVMALPIASLLAILLGLGRLAEDRELTAMQALGVGPGSVLAGALAMAAGVSGLLWLLACTGQPWGLTALQGMVTEVIKKNVIGDVKAGVFYEDLSQLTLYAEQVGAADGKWTNVLIHDDRDPASPVLVLAHQGKVSPAAKGEALRLTLADGQVHRADRASSDYAVITFERGDISVGLEESITRKNRFGAPSEALTPFEVLELAREAESRGEDPTSLRMAFHRRLGQALSPLSLALLAAPLAMRRRPGGRARGYLLALAGYASYYILYRFFEQMAFKGHLPVAVAGELANVILGGLGLWAFASLLRQGTGRVRA
ncbi:MAG TPA: LptF/LptG family permease [Myxococcaceae bacterium]|nr:LptF/LptG family permease [Myxococcaceae bacterium]